jgi:hypothetical protein
MYVDDLPRRTPNSQMEVLLYGEDVEKSHWETKSAGSRSGHCLILHRICANARTDNEVDKEGSFGLYFSATPTKLLTRLPHVVSSEI